MLKDERNKIEEFKLDALLLKPELSDASSVSPVDDQDDPLLLKQLMKFDSAKEFISFWNYPHEEHRVSTEDGYMIGLHRIPHGYLDCLVGNPHASKRKAVLIWHGLSISSDIFVCNTSRERNFAFVLADAGFDVWLANSRGNKYSRQVPDLCSSREERLKFWQFSFDHMAKYDVPAVVDYILNKTGHSSLAYIGYSQGTSKVFAALSISEDLNKKISQVIALAPALRPKPINNDYINHLIKTFKPRILYPILGSGSFLPFVHSLKKTIPSAYFSWVIQSSLQVLLGWKSTKFGPWNRRKLLFRHLFEDASITNLVHWFQIIEGGEFTMFDSSAHNFFPSLPTQFSPKTVIKYPTNHISTRIHLFYGEKDTISDIEYLKSHLPETTEITMIKDYEHLDFLWADCANSNCWAHVVKALMDNLEKNTNNDGDIQ